MQTKILLLNPPQKNNNLLRDYSCPHSCKGDYSWPPIDLLAISGIIRGNKTYYIDAIKEKLNISATIKKIKKINPDFIFMLISSISEKEDISIIKEIKKEINTKISVSGDIASFIPKRLANIKEIDYIIQDFTQKKEIKQIIEKENKKKIIGFGKNKTFSIGIPQHKLFIKYKYHMPYSLYPITCLLTNYGCAFGCKFCNSNKLGFKYRDLDEVFKDIEYIKKTNIKEFYFRDFTFSLPNTEKILNFLINKKINIKFSCEPRVDTVNQKILKLMKKAGCYLVFYGIESGNKKTLDLMHKGFKIENAIKTMRLTKKLKIETLNSFILGFPSETYNNIQKTIKLIFKLDPDYLSINVLVPRLGSIFRQEKKIKEIENLDCSSSLGMIDIKKKSPYEIKIMMEKHFYFRLTKLIKYTLLALKSRYRFLFFIKNKKNI